MAMQNQGVPAPAYPFVDNSGKINPIWLQFLTSLWLRTGGSANEGNVQSVTVTASNGLLATVTNPTSQVEIDLSLGGIFPSSVTTNGAVIGASGSFSTGLSTAGGMQFGAFVGTPIGNTGYIQITDASGNARKLMVGT